MLTAVRGVGPWTVDMFSMFHLGRPDILPVGDLAVRKVSNATRTGTSPLHNMLKWSVLGGGAGALAHWAGHQC